ncbi:MAG: PAS domain S-box protein [Anaerolineae bacterium]|nr:PAS domain S-box protein [Anaerolineae bacterium]
MNLAEQINKQWEKRQKEMEMVWWLLPGCGQAALGEDVAAKLQARIKANLLMTPFASESGRQVGKQLAQQFKFHMEKLGRLQLLLAEQLLAELDAQQVVWLTPRLTAFWAEMTIGYGLALRELYITEQAALQKRLLSERQEVLAQKAESEERFAALFEKTYSPVLIHENGRILAINKAVIERFGYRAEMLVGQEIQTLIQALTPLPEQTKILERIQAGDEQPYRTQCFKRDDTAVTVEIMPQRVSYQGGMVDMVVLRPLDKPLPPQLAEPENAPLSPRQQAVLQLMATGLSYKKIAKKLQITLPTVHHHRQEIFAKLQVSTRADAAVRAVPVTSETSEK